MSPELSSDGQLIASIRRFGIGSRMDVSIQTAGGGIPSQFTFDSFMVFRPVWAADDSRIAFGEIRDGVSTLVEKSLGADGTSRRLLADTSGDIAPGDWSQNGRREISSRREIGPRTDFSPSCVLRSALRISGCCPPTVTKSHSQPLSPNTATSSPSFLQTGSFSPTRRTTTDVTMCTSFPFGPRAQGAEFRPMVAERHDGEAMGRSSSIRALTER